jgi:hypothetical protein
MYAQHRAYLNKMLADYNNWLLAEGGCEAQPMQPLESFEEDVIAVVLARCIIGCSPHIGLMAGCEEDVCGVGTTVAQQDAVDNLFAAFVKLTDKV